ncbi:hypothetical protein MP228_007111 [Amoeboaphelidium protococcarum]|nr:hypothetical protein MP228_007111 [Amoeboaphelidium protococcarum]
MSQQRSNNNGNVAIPKSKPMMSESLRQRIAEITTKASDGKQRAPPPGRDDFRKLPPSQVVDRQIDVPPRRPLQQNAALKQKGQEKSQLDAPQTTPLAQLPRRPSRKPSAPMKKLLETSATSASRKQQSDYNNKNDSGSANTVLSRYSPASSSRGHSRANTPPRARTPERTDSVATAGSNADSKDRVKIIEQTRARLIGMMKQAESNKKTPTASPTRSPPVIRTPPSTNLLRDQNSSNRGDAASSKQDDSVNLKSFFSMSSATNDQASKKMAGSALSRRNSRDMPQLDSKFIDALKDKHKEEIELVKSELELANLTIANMQNKLSTKDKSGDSKIAELQQRLDDQDREFNDNEAQLKQQIARLQTQLRTNEQLAVNRSDTELSDLRRKLQDAEHKLKDYVPLDELQNVQKSYEDEINSLKYELQSEKDEYYKLFEESAQWESRLKLIQQKLADAEMDLASKSDECDQLRTQYDDVAQQLAQEKKNNRYDRTAVAELEKKVAALEQENASFLQQAVDYQNALDDCKDMKQRLDIYQNMASNLEDDKQHLQRQLDEQQRQFEQQGHTSDEMQELQDQVRELERELQESRDEAERGVAEAQKSLRDLLVIYETVQMENEKLRSQSNGGGSALLLKRQIDQLTSERTQLNDTIDKLEEYVEELSNLYSDSHSYAQNLEAELENAKSSAKQNRDTDSNVVYISNENDLLQFIETMTAKVDHYRAEVDNLRSENKRLRAGTQPNHQTPMMKRLVYEYDDE